MDDYIFTKRHIVDALNRAANEGHLRAKFGVISEREAIGFSAGLMTVAKEIGVDKEYANSVPAAQPAENA